MNLTELTALYSPLDIQYAQAMSGPYEDLSFRSDEVTVIAGLKRQQITGFWRPMVAVGDKKCLLKQIKRLYNICPNIHYQDFLVDGELSVVSRFLLEKGYVASPYYTQMIDLTRTEAELHVDLRKSYKSLVSKGEPYHCRAEHLRRLHIKARGKETRTPITWQIQQQMICKSEAFCLVLENSGGLFYCSPHICYYGVGVAGEGSHAVLWAAIKHAKSIGCKKFEMGEQVFYGDDKLMNISKFKRGFGGYPQVYLEVRPNA